jgi:ABC-2 type transport system ATP-binding protein
VGSTTGLLGGNGASKTTIIAMIMGLIEPMGGSIHAFGHDMAHERRYVLGRMNLESPYVDTPRAAQSARLRAALPRILPETKLEF